jgi:hypothetical protein
MHLSLTNSIIVIRGGVADHLKVRPATWLQVQINLVLFHKKKNLLGTSVNYSFRENHFFSLVITA